MNFVSLDDLTRRLDLTGSTGFDVELDESITAASRAIEAWCGRTFSSATASTTLHYWPRWDGRWWVIDTEDLHTVTSVKHDPSDTGAYDVTLTETTDFLKLPRNNVRAGISGWPTCGFRLLSGFSPRTSGDIEPFQVVGKLGWAETPVAVRQACLILAEELFKMRDAPFGVLQGWNDFGPVRVSGDTFRRVRALLDPFAKLGGVAMPGIA